MKEKLFTELLNNRIKLMIITQYLADSVDLIEQAIPAIEKEQDPLIQMMLRSKLDQLKEQAQQFIKIGNNMKNEILRLEKLYENCPDDSTMN